MLFMRKPYTRPLELVQRYGDPFILPTIHGVALATGQPEGIKEIFSADPMGYSVIGKDLAGVFGERSVLMLEGEAHRQERKLLAPPFHGARMRAYGTLIREVARRRSAAWANGAPFDATESARSMALDVMMQAVFGVNDVARADELSSAIIGAMQKARPSFVIFKFLRHEYGGLSAYARFKRAMARAEKFLYEEIDARRAQQGEDVLSMLLAARYEDGSPMSDQSIKEELMMLLQAGHETTAIMIAWTLYEIHRHPEVLERLRAEVLAAGDADPDAIARLPYLEAVCNETLRLYPLASAVMRKVIKPMTVLGHEVPVGGCVAAVIQVAHQNQELYPEPEKFKPERFLERRFTPFEFMPFGGGTRRCVGAALAVYEMKLVIATLLSTLRLKLVTEEPIGPTMKVAFIAPDRPIRFVCEAAQGKVARCA